MNEGSPNSLAEAFLKQEDSRRSSSYTHAPPPKRTMHRTLGRNAFFRLKLPKAFNFDAALTFFLTMKCIKF